MCLNFNDRTVAIQTLAQAIYNQRELGNIYDCGTITQCEVLNEIFLLDLSTGLYRCSNIISVLCDLGIDVINEQFFNYQKELPHSVLKDATINLFSNNKQIAQDAANEIDKFFLLSTWQNFKNIEWLGPKRVQKHAGYVLKPVLHHADGSIPSL